MKKNKFIIGFFTGYIVCMLIIYFIFDYFSWSFVVGSLTGIALFGIIINVVSKKSI
ncbi:hypothetical protein ACFFHH_24220 [Cytobacillus solani]|uniref:hypothetical protein n=1 Tax=Cytobacillus solani TaxID=1637975 RepID=UPI000AD9D78A|nr:hypothetical protein [Cytobacillus solani]USK52958.1 hypothetical protein LIS82_15130 [Cytobacillus solani]